MRIVRSDIGAGGHGGMIPIQIRAVRTAPGGAMVRATETETWTGNRNARGETIMRETGTETETETEKGIGAKMTGRGSGITGDETICTRMMTVPGADVIGTRKMTIRDGDNMRTVAKMPVDTGDDIQVRAEVGQDHHGRGGSGQLS